MEKVSCDACGKKFNNQDALKQHKNDAHAQSAASEIKKSKMSTGRILIVLIPLVIVGIVGYGVYWALTTEGVGTLGSRHIHADFAIFLNGEEITPLPQQYYVLSPYVHIETGPGAGSVIHIHATNVPLDMFFKSLGMKLTPECFEIGNDANYCSDGINTLKMSVKRKDGNWTQNSEYGKYIFQDLDKILITYGDETDEEIQMQQNNVTDFSKDNSGRSMALGR